MTNTELARAAQALGAQLRYAQDKHHEAEARLPKHDWTVWYAAFIVAKQDGRDFDQATFLADSAVLGSLVPRFEVG